MSTKALKEGRALREKEASLVIPPPPVPTKVLRSRVEAPSPPVLDEGVPSTPIVEEREPPEELIKREVEKEGKETGTIVVHLYNNKPYVVDFSGHITGNEIPIVWRALFKQYRVWKHKLSKEGGK